MRGSALPRLHAIVDVEAARQAGWTAEALARAFLDGGARLIQVRAKRLPSGPFLDLCDRVVPAAARSGAIVIVNDRVDLAALCGAAGVHVGQDDLPPAEARKLLGPDAIVGYSTHSLAQVQAARLEPVSYVAVGPVFGTRTKQTGYEAVGLGLVREARAVTGLPIVAIGGVTLDTAAAAVDAGASAVAVIGDLLAGGDPARRVRQFLDRLGSRP